MIRQKKRKWTREIKPAYDRDVHEVLNKLRNLTAYRISRLTFVSASTVYKLRLGYKNGGTRYPTHLVMTRLAQLAGYEYTLTKIEDAPKRKGARLEARAN